MKINPADMGLKYPRYMPAKSKSNPKVVEKERTEIQPAVDAYLAQMKKLYHIEVIRIPDLIYAVLREAPGINKHIRMKMMSALRSIPDNVIIKRGKKYNDCLCLELKTEGNDLSQGQRKFAKNVNVEVRKSIDSSIKEIDEFLKKGK